jgi:hypothetical protein
MGCLIEAFGLQANIPPLFVAMGTTTGAYWSGQRVAEKIIEAYGVTREDA